VQARAAGISYVQLTGEIACVVNGAGLAMATMDVVSMYGRNTVTPASFLDIGGGADIEKVALALRIALQAPNVRVMLVNVFGGMTRCDQIAHGIVQAYQQTGSDIPLVVRLRGTNATMGRDLIDFASLPHVTFADTLTEAALHAVEVAQALVQR
jgi:succinyl-CoA synthetase beta subunit